VSESGATVDAHSMANIMNHVSKRRAGTAIAIVVLVALGLWLYMHRYPTARPPTACEKFTAGVAIDFVRPDWCRRIPIGAERGAGGWSPKGFQVDSWRSDCFLATAVVTRNVNLCKDVKPIRTGLLEGYLDGTGYNKAYCVDRVNKSNGFWGELGLLPMSNGELAPIMRELGYTDQALLDANLDPHDPFSWSKYIQLLRSSYPPSRQLQRSDFLARVENLRCKGKWSPF